jgi:DNA polymerase III delta prime subunit
MIKALLTEKLRPKELRHMILPARIKDAFINGLQQNVLFVGSAGCGKTTLAKILAAPHPHLYLNMSDENSIETIRTKITDFCSTISIMDGANSMKVVIMDEFDGLSNQALLALKVTIEKFSKGTRFVGVTNYLNKIPDPIQSRLETFIFDSHDKDEEALLREEWKNRIKLILSKLEIRITDSALTLLVKKNFPDMRSVLNTIQRWDIQNIREIDDKKIADSWNFEDLYNMLVTSTDPIKNYQIIVGQYSSDVDEIMASLGNEFIQWIQEKHPALSVIVPGTIILVAQHQAQRNLVIDPSVSLLSLFFSIQKMIQQYGKK